MTIDAKEARETLGITQSQMARICRTHSMTISKWETGKRSPRGQAVAIIDLLLWLHDRGLFTSYFDSIKHNGGGSMKNAHNDFAQHDKSIAASAVKRSKELETLLSDPSIPAHHHTIILNAANTLRLCSDTIKARSAQVTGIHL